MLNKKTPSDIREVCEAKQSDSYKDLGAALARIERFCVGLECKIYDLQVFYKIAQGYFDKGTLYQRIAPILESKCSRWKRIL